MARMSRVVFRKSRIAVLLAQCNEMGAAIVGMGYATVPPSSVP